MRIHALLVLGSFLSAGFVALVAASPADGQSVEAPSDLELSARKASAELQLLTVEVSWTYPHADASFELGRGFFSTSQDRSEVEYLPLDESVMIQNGSQFLFEDVEAWDISGPTPCYRVRAVLDGVGSAYAVECLLPAPSVGGPDPTPLAPITGGGQDLAAGGPPLAPAGALSLILLGAPLLGLSVLLLAWRLRA